MIWSEPEQGLVLGSYFWGYFITQVPGGRISELYGGKWVFWFAVLLNILGIILSPACSYAGYQYLILMRIIMGLGAGVTFPAMNVLIAAWSPADERSSISALVYGGKVNIGPKMYTYICIAYMQSMYAILERETPKSKTSSGNMFTGIDILQ